MGNGNRVYRHRTLSDLVVAIIVGSTVYSGNGNGRRTLPNRLNNSVLIDRCDGRVGGRPNDGSIRRILICQSVIEITVSAVCRKCNFGFIKRDFGMREHNRDLASCALTSYRRRRNRNVTRLNRRYFAGLVDRRDTVVARRPYDVQIRRVGRCDSRFKF